ncbi:hypothetical protein GCK32_002252, partial [Trichostrongylus colubriformis]
IIRSEFHLLSELDHIATSRSILFCGRHFHHSSASKLEANISEFLQMAEKNAERHNILKKMFSIYQGSKDIVKQITTEGKKKQEPSGLKYGDHLITKHVQNSSEEGISLAFHYTTPFDPHFGIMASSCF